MKAFLFLSFQSHYTAPKFYCTGEEGTRTKCRSGMSHSSPIRDVIVEEHRRIDEFFCQEIRTKNSDVKVSEQESFHFIVLVN